MRFWFFGDIYVRLVPVLSNFATWFPFISLVNIYIKLKYFKRPGCNYKYNVVRDTVVGNTAVITNWM